MQLIKLLSDNNQNNNILSKLHLMSKKIIFRPLKSIFIDKADFLQNLLISRLDGPG